MRWILLSVLLCACGGSDAVPAEVRVLATEPADRIVNENTGEIGLLFRGTRDGTVVAALGDPDSTGSLSAPVDYAAGSLGWITVSRDDLTAGGHWIAVALTPDDEGPAILDEVAFTVDAAVAGEQMPACLGACGSDGDCDSCPVPSACMDFGGEGRCIPSVE